MTKYENTLQVFSTLAVRAPFDNGLLAQYPAAGMLEIAWSPTTVIEQKLAENQHADVIIATDGAVAKLQAAGLVDPTSVTPLVSAYFGVAVAADAPQPDISSKAAFLQALRTARSVAYSLGGASGIYLQQVMAENGILADVEARASKIQQGFTAEKLLSGEADLAVQQMSELMVVPGIAITGPFPDEVQQITPFSVAITRRCRAPEQASAFIAYLQTAACRSLYDANGLKCR